MSDFEAKSDPEVTDNNTRNLETQPTSLQPKLKEGGYGWVVVTAAALLNAHTWGLNSSFAVFLAYYLRNNSIEGASSLGFAFVGGLSISISFLISPLATLLVGWRPCGTRKTIFIGTIFETIAFIGASFTSELWHLVLSQGICFGIGMGLIFVSSVPVPSQWFSKRRSLANAVAAGGSGFGGLTYSLATNAMIAHVGLAWTFRVLAIICFVVNSICSYLVRDRNRAVGSVHVAVNWALLRRPPYLLYLAWMSFSMVPYVGLVFSVVDYSQTVGLTAAQASLVGALLNLSQGIGRPIIGMSSDSIGRLNVAGVGTAFCGVLCVTLWVFSKSLATCIVFALLVGGVAGVMWAAAAPVLAEVIGLQMLPSGLSMTWLVLVLPATFAEVIVLEIRSRSYRGAQLFIGFMYLMAFVNIWILRAWKVREIRAAKLTEKQRERAIRDDDVAVAAAAEHQHDQDGDEEPQAVPVRRIASVASTAKKGFQLAQGLWAWERV